MTRSRSWPRTTTARSIPALGTAYNLTATRSSFFDEPNADAADAAGRSRQVDSRLVATVRVEQEPTAVELDLRLRGPRRTIRAGGSARLTVEVTNAGTSAARDVEICPSARRRLARVGGCKGGERLAGGADLTRSFRIELRRRAASRRNVKVRFRDQRQGRRDHHRG